MNEHLPPLQARCEKCDLTWTGIGAESGAAYHAARHDHVVTLAVWRP